MRKFMTKTMLGSSVMVMVLFTGSAVAIGGLTSERAAQAQEATQTRLEGIKLRACENRERVINNMLDRITKRGERRLNVYNAIAERVQEFYTKKGLSLSNYDDLVTDVDAKKAAAQTLVDQIKAKEVNFTCDGSDPKGTAASIKEDLRAEIKALHDYQQSIKDLIVAVKTAISDSNQNNSDGSEGEQ